MMVYPCRVHQLKHRSKDKGSNSARVQWHGGPVTSAREVPSEKIVQSEHWLTSAEK